MVKILTFPKKMEKGEYMVPVDPDFEGQKIVRLGNEGSMESRL